MLVLALPLASGFAAPAAKNATAASSSAVAMSSSASSASSSVDPNGRCVASDNQNDCFALVMMWYAFGQNIPGWKVDGQMSMCAWDGVTCTSDSPPRVTKLCAAPPSSRLGEWPMLVACPRSHS
eukprot:2671125-Prymnesium_polylepis.1